MFLSKTTLGNSDFFLYLYTECKTCFYGKNSPSADILSLQKNVKPFFARKVLAVIQTLLYLFTCFFREVGGGGGILCVSENTSSSQNYICIWNVKCASGGEEFLWNLNIFLLCNSMISKFLKFYLFKYGHHDLEKALLSVQY